MGCNAQLASGEFLGEMSGEIFLEKGCPGEMSEGTVREDCVECVSGFIIIIIMWLVQRRTLPFLRACSMPVDSALGDRRLLDQC